MDLLIRRLKAGILRSCTFGSLSRRYFNKEVDSFPLVNVFIHNNKKQVGYFPVFVKVCWYVHEKYH